MNKNSISKRDIATISLICLLLLSIVFSIVGDDSVYGSVVDWASQHSVFPEYFRDLFYETGELIPSLAQNLGAAENIYYISYYGLLSPHILLSYLLPFVEMTDYIVAISLISLLSGVILFYFWIRKRHSIMVSTLLTAFFALSGPLIFHSHRHIMFVIYMPLLIAALFFVDLFFEKNIRSPLAVTVFLIVMSSYFFSVSAIVAITIYGIFRYIEKVDKTCGTAISLRGFAIEGGKFAYVIIVGVMMSALLLIPTAFALLGGRNPTNSGIGIVDLLPSVMLEQFTGGGYSMGLSTFVIFATIDLIIGERRHYRFLAVVFAALLTCPVFLYVLNGFEYLDGKVLIPFIPLALVLCGKSVERIFDRLVNFKIVIPIFILATVIGLFSIESDSSYIPCIVDLVVVLSLCSLASGQDFRVGVSQIAVFALLAVPLVNCIVVNDTDDLTTKKLADNIGNKTATELIEKVAENEDSLFRTAYNLNAVDTPNKLYSMSHYTTTLYSSLRSGDYNRFYFDVFCNENSYRNRAIMSTTKNIFFNAYMGNKYWITSTNGGYVPENCILVEQRDDMSLYEASGTLPVGYVSDRLMSLEEFNTLEYPQTMEALMLYTVVDKELPRTDFISSFERIELCGIFDDSENLAKTDDGYRYIKGSGESKYYYKLPDNCRDKTLVLRFKVDNTVGAVSTDIKIWVNGAANKLTAADWKYYNGNTSFEYVISPVGDDGDMLRFTLPDKDYEISDVELWICDFDDITARALNVDAFSADMSQTMGDRIIGNVTASSDGYFNLSYVYSDGYTVLVDGNEVTPECVDTCFVGFPISAGEHTIDITFTAPGLGIGKCVSVIGIVALLPIIAVDVYQMTAKRRKREEL